MRRVLLKHQLPVQPGMCWLMFYPFLLAGSRSDGNLEEGHWKDLMWRETAVICKIPVVKAYLVIVSFPFLIIDQLCEILDHIRNWNCQIKVLMRPVYDSLISRNLFAAFSSSGLRSGWYCMESRSQASLQLNRTRWMAPTGEYWSSCKCLSVCIPDFSLGALRVNFKPVVMALIVFQLCRHPSATHLDREGHHERFDSWQVACTFDHQGHLSTCTKKRHHGFKLVLVEVARAAWFFCKHRHGWNATGCAAFSNKATLKLLF